LAYNKIWFDLTRNNTFSLPIDLVEQYLACFFCQPGFGYGNGSEWRTQVGRNGNIIQPDNRNILRDTQPCIQHSLHRAESHPVGCGENRGWTYRKSKQPLRGSIPAFQG